MLGQSGVLSLLLSELGSLDSLAVVSGVDSGLSELLVDLGSLHLLGQSLDLASLDNLWKSEHTGGSVLSGGFNLLSGGVGDLALLDLTVLSWEEDELGLVVGQSLDVGVLHVSGLVMSSVVDSDSDSLGKGWSDFGSFELGKSESSSELNLSGILSSLTLNQWSQL